jgi:hypothetical protein
VLVGDMRIEGPKHGALLTEVLAVVCERFPEQDARDIYVEFVLKHRDRYVEPVASQGHWGWTVIKEDLSVDILMGVAPLVKSGDPRAKQVVSCLMKTLMAKTFRQCAVWRLDDAGQSLALHKWTAEDAPSRVRGLYSPVHD